MTATSTAWTWILAGLHWLAGPVLSKELRVAGRQRRSYLLRLAYVGALTFVLVCIWADFTDPGGGSPVYQTSRLAAAGRIMTVALVWFQFVVAQLAAMLLLSDAISGEVRKRTLHILAVTPLSGVQVAVGKLVGGLLPILMLLAISLPLLAVVRAFGGVPWGYLVSAISVTFSATVFAGTVFLLASACRGSALAVLASALWFCLLTRIGDILLVLLARPYPAVGVIGGPILALVNPTDILLTRTREMLGARPGSGWSFWWLLHCLILLAAAVVVLWWTGRRIRRAAAEPPSDRPQGSQSPTWIGAGTSKAGRGYRRAKAAGPIRRVEGSPVLWKELRTFTVVRNRHPLTKYSAPVMLGCFIIATALGVGVLGVRGSAPVIAGTTAFCALGLHIGVAVGFSGAAAAMIPKEREARTLPLLLATPLEAGQIVRDKALAVLRQSLPMLVPPLLFFLFASACVLVSVANQLPPLLLARIAGLYLGFYLAGLLGILPFLLGLGLYCGVRLKTIAAARGCTFTVVLLGALVFCVVAAAVAVFIVRSGSRVWLTLPVVAVGAALVCAGAGLVLLRATARQLRRHVF